MTQRDHPPFRAAMRPGALLAGLLLALSTAVHAQEPEATHFPGPGGDWERQDPEDVGMDAERLQEAVEFSRDHPTDIPREALLAIQQWRTGNEDTHRETIGPVRDHGDEVTGLIIKDGYIVAEWGEPERVDMSYSVTKSFVSITAGLALDEGLIEDFDDPVHHYIRGQDGFDDFSSEHNRQVTWDHLLRMTSEWEGEVWGKPWHAEGRREPRDKPLQEPGTHYVYSNVTSARLALALMQIWREPLPSVLKERVMDPIGASPTWRWKGYDNAWVEIDGRWMQGSSSGGGWGGSMWIDAFDMGRVGLLALHRGEWDGERLLSEGFFQQAETPTKVQEDRGFINWNLNPDREVLPSAPESAVYHSGSGNRIYVDPEHELVVVIRWMDTGELDGLVERVLEAVDG